jgi:ethanolamine ammonia-lyase large subunit
MVRRRSFLQGLAASATIASPDILQQLAEAADDVQHAAPIAEPLPREDVFEFIQRLRGAQDTTLYAQILGAANEFKEGDRAVGVAAADVTSRRHARVLLANTRLADIDAHSLHRANLFAFISVEADEQTQNEIAGQTLGQFKRFLLTPDEVSIKDV